MGHMTQPAEFYKRITETLQFLDTKLPNNSHVVFVGLMDGEVLWETMKNVIHPGLNTTYANVWEFTDCYEINACYGWLNKNATMRQLTTERKEMLNAVFPKIIAEQKYKHFDMIYIHNPFKANLEKWVASGGKGSDMCEIMDGGHPRYVEEDFTQF